ANVTRASQRLVSQFTVKLLEQVTTGRWVSVTRTVKVQWLVLPTASVAVQFTNVVPRAKSVPERGVHTSVAPGQLSENEGSNWTGASQRPIVAAATTFVGQRSVGGSASRTVTLKAQV